MPPKKSKTPAGTYTDKETGKTVTKPDSRAPVYGAWKRFRPTENAGYDWFPFSVGNWLTSPLVNAMDLKEQGIYIRLLACQWRDGYLAIHPASLVAQAGIDVRTLVHWMMRFGDETMVCIDHPDGECDIFAMWQKLAELGRDRQRTRAMWRNLAEVSATERHAAVNCRHMANGKLHYLAIKQGKISLAICRGEENRIDGERDGEGKDYHVWCDLPRLLGGERFWAEIESRIRDEAVKVLYILSKTSNSDSDRGFRKELHLADSEAKRHLANGSKDFLIPIAVDNLRSAEYNVYVHQRNATPFQDCWAIGFAKLLKKLKLDRVPKRMPNGGDRAVAEWWDKFRSSSMGVKKRPSEFLSNWFPITSLPKSVYVFKLADVSGKKVERIEYDLQFPVGQQGDFIMTFSSEVVEQLPSNLSADVPERLCVEDVLSGRAATSELDSKTLKNTLLSLLRVAWEKWVLSDKTESFKMANHRLCAYFPKPEEGDLKGYFTGTDGRRSWRGLTGSWTVKSRLNPGASQKRYWHFGIQAQPKAYPELIFIITSHVLFSDDGRELWSDKRRMHRARRSRCKNWYNEEWRDRLRASLGLLSSEQSSIKIPVAEDQYIVVDTQPLLFHSDYSFDVLADKSKSKAEAILAEKEEGEQSESGIEDDDETDDEFDDDEGVSSGEKDSEQ